MAIGVLLTRTAAFAAVYVAATLAGRMTIMHGTSLSMVWPAAGVAVVWFCAQRRARTWRIDVTAFSAITLVVNVATGAGVVLALAFVVANLVQAGVFVHLMSRWRPHLWGAGGTDGLRGPRDLWALLAAGFTATVSGALIGPTAVWLTTGTYSVSTTAVWLVRNTASMLLIGAVGLSFGHALATWHRQYGSIRLGWAHAAGVLARTPRWRLAEYAGLALFSTAAYLAGFAYAEGLPIAFTLIGLTVWAATRLATPFVVLHDLAVGTIVVLFTLHGNGPFAGITSDPMRAFVAQLFVAMVAVVGLALALGRDERRALLIELAADKEDLAAAREQASQRADLLHAIIDSMADGLSVTDADGHVVLRNPAAVSLLGETGNPTSGNQDGFFRLDGTPLTANDLPQAIAEAGDAGSDILVRKPRVADERILHLKATTAPDSHGQTSTVLIYTDVTAERRQRDELAGFAGVVAHDLLNPLFTVQGWTTAADEILDELAGQPIVEQARDNLRRVSRAATRMGLLINDLLAYTTTRDATLVSVRVDVADVVTDIVHARTDAAAVAGDPVPQFTIGRIDAVHADAVLVRQLLDNLIGNAIKYTAPEVIPHLTITSTINDGAVQVSIADNGIGIPAGQHEAIFGNFHRAHRTDGYAGTGLGLAICKRIIERHGGTITATNNPGGGSRFTFSLPVAQTSATTDAAATAAPSMAGQDGRRTSSP
jgi:signal transduction histidine kinase